MLGVVGDERLVDDVEQGQRRAAAAAGAVGREVSRSVMVVLRSGSGCYLTLAAGQGDVDAPDAPITI